MGNSKTKKSKKIEFKKTKRLGRYSQSNSVETAIVRNLRDETHHTKHVEIGQANRSGIFNILIKERHKTKQGVYNNKFNADQIWTDQSLNIIRIRFISKKV